MESRNLILVKFFGFGYWHSLFICLHLLGRKGYADCKRLLHFCEDWVPHRGPASRPCPPL